MARIETERLTKRYGEHRGIEDVSLSIEEGEVFGFIGPNGAGKSTTIRTLLGLLVPTSGTATILGKRAADEPEWVFQRVGYLPADVRSYDRMRVGRFLELTAGFYEHDCSARAKELVASFEIDETRRFGELSTGNKKKVGIVQCFMHRPDVIVLDEPTTGLDPLMQARFYELLNGERDRGATVLFSSHTLSEVQQQCSRIAIIRQGRIVESGPLAELRSRRVRRLRVTGSDRAVNRVAALSGVQIERSEAGRLICLYSGTPNDVIAALGGEQIADLLIEEPSLEEVFLHYYTEE
ncbi:MAG: ABC transporter ATP-binding protein [Spirochaetota bacterium]